MKSAEPGNPSPAADVERWNTRFAGMMRALAPGGLLLVQGYAPRQLEYKTGGPPVAEQLHTEALLRDSFSELEILHLEEHDDVVREGSAHVGMSALIDLVARKTDNN